MAVNHQADIIRAYFQDGAKWEISIDYSLESKPLSTMGPLRLINNLPEHFLVMNGDIISDVDYSLFLNEHVKRDSMFSILAHNRQEKVDYGALSMDSSFTLTGFEEKPVNNYLVSMGIYAVNRCVLNYIPEDEPFGFDDLMRKFLSLNIAVNVIPHDGYWLDIGRPDDYIRATEEFDSIKHVLKIEG